MSEDAEPTLVGEQSESQKFSKNKSKKTKSICGSVAQLVEQRTENPCVAGSNPALATTYFNDSSPTASIFSDNLNLILPGNIICI
jgi:hypothetical protein